MKFRILFALLVIVLISCQKNDPLGSSPGTLCADTSLLPLSITEPLQSVFFLNDSTGFAGGSNGGIYKTTNGGNSWTNEPAGISMPVYSICFVNVQTGFAAGGLSVCNDPGCTPEGGFILKTTDGGSTWKKVFMPAEKVEVRSLYFLNETTGYGVSGTTVLKTINGGESWSEYTMPNLQTTLMQVKFANAQQGYIACLYDILLTTADGGSTWQVRHPLGDETVGYYSIATSGGALYMSGQKKILKSTDNGFSWATLSRSPSNIFAVYFTDEATGFAVGSGNYSGGDFGYSYGALYCTSDGGNTWQGTSDIKETGAISAVSFSPRGKVGYAISRNRVIRLSPR